MDGQQTVTCGENSHDDSETDTSAARTLKVAPSAETLALRIPSTEVHLFWARKRTYSQSAYDEDCKVPRDGVRLHDVRCDCRVRDVHLTSHATLRTLAFPPSHAKFMLQRAKFVTPPSQSGLSVLICC
ncbi:hypothetical protein EIQ04_17020 [Xanthomonas campestris pv. raphani]